MDVFLNKNLLRNVRKANLNLAIFLTGGKTTTNLVGDLPGYGTMWFHPGVMANIISLSKVADKYWVCYDSNNRN